MWSLVFVLHEESDRCSKSDAMLNTGLYLNKILLVSL